MTNLQNVQVTGSTSGEVLASDLSEHVLRYTHGQTVHERPLNQDVLVSIIINNYNYGCFLKDAIESALAQTYRGIEIIVVDDGSTDCSGEVMLGYGDRIISLFKQNGGQASALNSGFVQSRGDIVIFLDADDILRSDIVQRVVEVFQSDLSVSKVMYRMEVVDGVGMQTGILKPSAHLPMRSGDLREYILTCPFDMTWMATSGNAFAARVLRQIFPMPEQSFRILADFYLSHIAPLFGPVVFLSDVGAYYRIHGGNRYEPRSARIDLVHIRQTLQYSYNTCVYIKKFADKLDLDGSPREVSDLLSVSLIGERLMSLKLDPEGHPNKEDTSVRLFLLGLRAIFRRFDVSLPMKILYVLWFGAMVLSPRPLAWRLAEGFSFPENRSYLNKLLGRFHHM